MRGDLAWMKRYALSHGLCCGEFEALWDDAGDVGSLMDMATRTEGMEFMARAFCSPWGLSESSAVRMFSGWINGAWQGRHGRYTAEIWCGSREGVTFTSRSTLTLIAHSEMTFVVPRGRFCKLLLSGGGKVDIRCGGRVVVETYGKEMGMTIGGEGRWTVREANA